MQRLEMGSSSKSLFLTSLCSHTRYFSVSSMLQSVKKLCYEAQERNNIEQNIIPRLTDNWRHLLALEVVGAEAL